MAKIREAQQAVDVALASEMMRALFRVVMETIQPDGLARRAGVHTSALQAFMDGADPDVRICTAGERLADEYAPPEVQLEAVGLHLIADTFPPEQRAEVRRALADAVEVVLAAHGRTVDLWIRPHPPRTQ
ncbi:MAG TPA: hypothetical protein VFY65_18320 [Longimicrobium sp.]|nr:hypothetical protein [Longimicrobium sp.]